MEAINPWVNQVIEGNCLEVMPLLPAQSVDLVIADLPYGITHNAWDQPINLAALWIQYKRLIKPSGVIALTGQGLFTAHLIMSNPTMFRYKIVWIKLRATNFLNANKQPLRKHEDICVFYDGQPVYHPQMFKGAPYDKGKRRTSSDNYNTTKPSRIYNASGLRYPGDIVFYEEDPLDDFIYCPLTEPLKGLIHSTQKPVDLGRYLIRTYSNPGDVVLDNTCGSGSFLVAAIHENRQFIGIELNQWYSKRKRTNIDLIKICRERIARAIESANTFPF